MEFDPIHSIREDFAKITAITQGPSCDLVLTSGSDVLPQNVSRVAQEYKIWSPSLKPRMDPTPLSETDTKFMSSKCLT